MKRINSYLEESQIARIAKLAEVEGVSSAEMLRRCLMAGLELQEGFGPTEDIEFVRQRMIEKNKKEVTYQDEFNELAREKAIEYRDKENNRARITTIVEELRQLRASHDALSKLIKAREGEL